MRRPLIVLALVTGALVSVTGALAAAPPAGPEAAGIGIRLLDAPTDRQDDPRARLYVVDHIDLGDSIERRIEVANKTNETQQIGVYAAGAVIADGSFIGLDARTQNDLSSWTTLDQGTLELAAGTTGVVAFTVAVPDDAPPGEQYAVVWAEARSTPSAEGQITVVNRVGVRMYVDVGPGGEAASAFTITELTASREANDQPMVEATVTNTGGRALDLSGTLTLSNGPGGLSAGPFDALAGTTIGPGDTSVVTVALDELLPNGPWDALIELKSGLLSVSAEATISFPDTGVAAPVTITPATAGGLPLWAIAGGALALLVLLAVVVLFLRRRSRREEATRQGPQHAPQHALPATVRRPAGSHAR